MDVNSAWQSSMWLTLSVKVMLRREIDTDVTFVFPGSEEKIKAHQFILKCRSHVFYVMFNSNLHQPGKDIEIADIKPENFRCFIEYLYSDSTDISSENALALMYCSHKYNVNRLMTQCINFLVEHLDVGNVGQLLEQGLLYDELRLTHRCLRYFSLYPAACLKKFNRCHFSKEVIEAVVDRDSLRVEEVQIFQLCNHWATVECKKQGITANGQNKRKVLGTIWDKIRFCSMTTKDIASFVAPTKLMPSKTELEVYRYLNNPKTTKAPFPTKKRKLGVDDIKMPEVFYNNQGDEVENQRKKQKTGEESDSGVSIVGGEYRSLVGFIFSLPGEYRIWVNEKCHETIDVPRAGIKRYLEKPVHYRRLWHIAVTDSAKDSCNMSKKTLSEYYESRRFTIRKHGRSPLPFKTLVFA